MTQQATTAVTTAPQRQEAATPRAIDILKKTLNTESVQAQFKNALGRNSSTFIASVIDLYNGDPKLQQCKPQQVVSEALRAAVFHLPITKALGYAYIIPFNNSKKDERGNWIKVVEPTFQLGYKGYIQLAMRTGQYAILNADVVYEGELTQVNKLTGEIAFDGKKISDKIVGYFCYFKLLNGFSKTLYMTTDQMARHAHRFSKGLKKGTTIDDLLKLAEAPITESGTLGWNGNFHGMAIKTVIRNLLSKYGYLSVEMQDAIASDFASETDDNSMQSESVDAHVIEADEIEYEEVGNGAPTQVAPQTEEVPY